MLRITNGLFIKNRIKSLKNSFYSSGQSDQLFLRPDGSSSYLRSDGSSLFLRPN